MSTSPKRYRRGETTPERPGLVFFRYRAGREQWVSAESLTERNQKCFVTHKAWVNTAEGRDWTREYEQRRCKTPGRKEYNNARKRKPEIRERYREIVRNGTRKYSKTEKGKANARKQLIKHRVKINARRAEVRRWRMQNDPWFKMRHTASSAVLNALKNQGLRKRETTSQLLGCKIAFFLGWLEAQFQSGMNWQNHGSKSSQWEVDHVMPLASFNLADPKQRQMAFHYTNCRPMWAIENRNKADFIQHNGQRIRARYTRNIIQFKAA